MLCTSNLAFSFEYHIFHLLSIFAAVLRVSGWELGEFLTFREAGCGNFLSISVGLSERKRDLANGIYHLMFLEEKREAPNFDVGPRPRLL